MILALGVLLPATPARGQALPDPAPLTEVLARFVDPPRVDYAALAAEREGLDTVLEAMGAVDPAFLAMQPEADQIAFWINAYNACMLKQVIDHYPLDRGSGGFLTRMRNRIAGYPANSVWSIPDVFGEAHCRIAGAERSQDEIEHEILRPTFREPRIHFAVNCAARSCPILWPEAYEGPRLETQLDRAVRALMADPEHFRIEPGPPAVLRLNRVLDWYADDFGGAEGLKRFFRDYVDPPGRALLDRADTTVGYFEYDWTLNDRAP